MNLPAPPALRPDDFPDVDERFLEAVTRALRQMYDAMAAVPDLGVSNEVLFTSAAAGASSVDVKNPLGAKPRHVTVNVARDDRQALTAVWSFEWKMAGENIRLSLLGLPASVKLRLSLGAL